MSIKFVERSKDLTRVRSLFVLNRVLHFENSSTKVERNNKLIKKSVNILSVL